MPFAPEYVRYVLDDNFEDAKALFLSPLMAIHRAHLVMLAKTGIVSPADARRIREALDGISEAEVGAAPYDGSCEDLFFYVERLLLQSCGEDVAGRLHTARSRNDIDMTMYRMRQREWVLDLLDATLALRDARRLQAAYGSTNQSPLGACAITGTGFPIDRSLTSRLLGFERPTGNTYGSIASVDYLLESAGASAVLLVGLGRFVQDLLLWGTCEVGYVRFGDGFVQTSSIMPQKRNPVAIEHARAIGSKALGQAQAIGLAVHNTPFGDVVDTEDDLQPLVRTMFRDARRAVALVAAAMGTASFDVARLESRAGEGGTTMTELADTIVREHGLPFKTAHAMAVKVLRARAQQRNTRLTETLAAVSFELLGRPIVYREERLEEILSPRYFVAVRNLPGGPAPEASGRAIDAATAQLESDRTWLDERRAALVAAAAELQSAAAAL
jgi:argininosuccinate lyase